MRKSDPVTPPPPRKNLSKSKVLGVSSRPDAPAVSIVLPCLNEAETLPVCLQKAQAGLASAGLHGEIIVVDNGSTDKSVELAGSLGARVVSEPVRGYGAALRRGFAESHTPYIVMADADDSYDLRDVGIFVEKLSQGYDLVMGSRLKGRIAPGSMPWAHRYIGTPALTWLVNRLYFHTRGIPSRSPAEGSGAGISDVNCGMRALSQAGGGAHGPTRDRHGVSFRDGRPRGASPPEHH